MVKQLKNQQSKTNSSKYRGNGIYNDYSVNLSVQRRSLTTTTVNNRIKTQGGI